MTTPQKRSRFEPERGHLQKNLGLNRELIHSFVVRFNPRFNGPGRGSIRGSMGQAAVRTQNSRFSCEPRIKPRFFCR